LHGCKTWFLTLGEEQRLAVFEKECWGEYLSPEEKVLIIVFATDWKSLPPNIAGFLKTMELVFFSACQGTL
jgi:hypothetical protein